MTDDYHKLRLEYDALWDTTAELRAEVERLRDALRVITDVVPENYLRTVEAALEGGTDADEVRE